jgi:hypothetical protein
MQPTLGLNVEPPAPEVATGDAAGVATLPPSEVALSFGPEIFPGLPAPRSVVLSVLFHGLVIAALMTIRFPLAMPPPQPAQEALSPTEIRIGQHVYYVARIPPPEAPKQPATKRTPAPQRQAKGAPALALRTPRLVAPVPAPRALPRAFIPPEIRQSAAARQTLIQPLSPPDLVPPATPLPTFRILAAQIPKLAKPFVAPGRPNPPPAQLPVLNPPAPMEMVHADPQPTNLRPKLALPRTPPPLDAPPAFDAPDLPPPIPAGDPVNILSLNDRNIPMTDRLVVPPGNIAQISGEGASAGTGAGLPTGSAASETNPRASGTPSNNPSASHALGSSSAAGSPQGVPSGSSTTAIASSASPGSGSAVTGSAGPGAPGGVAGGVSVTGGSRPGVAGAAPLPTVIRRPANGNFDAMVVQTTPLNQYPESRSLLTGRPIYSVYFSVGTPADWTFYFCIPGEKPASSNTSVIQLGPPATPVKAPYPTKLVRPEIALPSWEKYVLVHGYVNEEGRFEGLRVVRSIQPGTDQALLASLSGWEFRAATKDGVGVMVEFLLSIPAKGL